MPRKRKRIEQDILILARIESFEAALDASINSDVYGPQYAWNLNDNDPVFTFTSSLSIKAETTYPDKHAGEGYELVLYGDDAPSRRLDVTLKDFQKRDDYGSPQYRQYRGKQIPIYDPPNGLGLIEKVRGELLWRGWLFTPTRFVGHAVALLSLSRPLYLTIHLRKEGRARCIRNLSIQTENPDDEDQ